MIEFPRTGASSDLKPETPTARLRILETTDLHMQLLDYDYFSDKADPHSGLIRLVGAITRARDALGPACLLFDNGDAIQGNPLADYLAIDGLQDETHPMIAAFNTLRYDGMALGNHEFNYGLDYLRQALSDAEFPIICANLTVLQGKAISTPYRILERALPCDDGTDRMIRIGVTGFVTPQITQWDAAVLDGAIITEDIIDSAQRLVPEMRAAGADVIIALCHSGIGAEAHTPGMENAAIPLAAIDGIDVVLTGHTHEQFPGHDRAANDVVDPVAGTLHGKPAVMAGFYGNRLGMVDLDLRWENDAWHIARHKVTLEKGEDEAPQTKPLRDRIAASANVAHHAALAHIRQPIAVTSQPIQSYFATIGHDPCQHLLATAQRRHIQDALHDGPWRHLPVISATSPFRFGDRAGPGHYIDLPAGPVTLRDAAAIYPFANTLCAVQQSGAELRKWLERAACHFIQVTPGEHSQPLIHPHSPGYNFDTLFGLDYEIDISKPARFDNEGQVINAEASRINRLCFQGHAVKDDDRFVVATNSYRTYGGGGIIGVSPDHILYTSTQSTRDILIEDLRAAGSMTCDGAKPWRFAPHPNTSAIFMSSPLAQAHLADNMQHLGPGRGGFDRYQLNL